MPVSGTSIDWSGVLLGHVNNAAAYLTGGTAVGEAASLERYKYAGIRPPYPLLMLEDTPDVDSDSDWVRSYVPERRSKNMGMLGRTALVPTYQT